MEQGSLPLATRSNPRTPECSVAHEHARVEYTRSRGRGEYPLMAKLGKFSVVSIPVFGITDTEQNFAALCQVSPLGGIRHDPVSDCIRDRQQVTVREVGIIKRVWYTNFVLYVYIHMNQVQKLVTIQPQ